MTAKPSQSVTLSAADSSDPDGNQIAYRWLQYVEAGSASRIEIKENEAATITFTAPNEPGKTLHVILELRDNGTPNLFAYRRIVVTIQNEKPSS